MAQGENDIVLLEISLICIGGDEWIMQRESTVLL